jgi:Aflatoxin regulatory protein/Fungal Zn(2)-Cys(6) binuclear cluster domain
MAAIQPSRPNSPASSAPKNGCRTAPEGSPLRKSCDFCASSKVKCSGRKPTCHRCAKRGFTCNYFAAKRAGRKPAASSSSNEDSSLPNHDAVERPPETTYATPPPTASDFSDFWKELGPLDVSLSSSLTHTDPNTQAFTPSFQVDIPDLDLDLPTTAEDLFSLAVNGNNSNSFEGISDASFGANDAFSDLLAFPMPTPRPTASASPTREVHNFPNAPATGQACSCLAQALGLMTQLSQSSSTASTTWTTQGLDDSTAIQTVQDVLRQSKTAVDAVGTMLQCPCSHDGYLLVVISLIAFRMLGLFAAVVLNTPGSQASQSRRTSQTSSSEPALQDPAVESSYRIEGKDWARMSAQAVLSELHSVRRLTKWLSSKLQLHTTQQGGQKEVEVPKNAALESEVRLPLLSGEVYKQLDADLNRRLKALYQGIIDRLRSF